MSELNNAIDKVEYDTIKFIVTKARGELYVHVCLDGKELFVFTDDWMDYWPSCGFYGYNNYDPNECLYTQFINSDPNDDSYWYHDPKNKCMRLWKYSLQDYEKLVTIQNFIWRCLEKENEKIYIEIVVKLSPVLPKDSIIKTCEYLDFWQYYEDREYGE